MEFLLIAAQDTIRTNDIKARIDKTQQNSKCRLCGDRDETINHIISECSKLAQKEYKTRHDWIGKVIHWEICKKFKFDHTNKWYLHNPAPAPENDTHKLGELIFIYCGLFVLILVVFVLFLLSLRFGQISPLAFFRCIYRDLG